MKEEPVLSRAHEASREFVIDPAYSVHAVKPASDARHGKAPWIYGNAQLEAWELDRLVQEGFAANRRVHYKRNYGRVASVVTFRRQALASALSSFTLRANGKITVRLDGQVVFEGAASDGFMTIPLPESGADERSMEVELNTTHGEPAALLVESGPFQTGESWLGSTDATAWVAVSAFPQTACGRMPHRREEPTMLLHPIGEEDGIFDFGITILARPVFRMDGMPVILTGESLTEAKATDDELESRHDLAQLPDGRWTSTHALGFRYLRIEGGPPREVGAMASFHPVRYRGAFACSDDRLTRIWTNAAFTFRTCMHRLMIDGIKRDRMPWVGDQASLIVNAYTFADADIVRRSLTALGRPTDGYINGIVDYSLWWVVNHELYQRYFDDPAYLKKEIHPIDVHLENMARLADAEGLLRAEGWIFIDWGVERDRTKTLTALQIMWYWAQRSAANLAVKAGDDEMAARWKRRADTLAALLQERAWNPEASAWREYLEDPATASPYPNLLAVLSGLARTEQHEGIRENLVAYPVTGTPFMTGLALMALSRVGGTDRVARRIRAYWGGMLQCGATTFWEDFKLDERDHYAMYGRPFGRSLCHAWSSGPAALLCSETLGVRPLCDGWKEFEVSPCLGDLTWAMASVPTPVGDIEVEADRRTGKAVVKIPADLTLVSDGERHTGPATLAIEIERTEACVEFRKGRPRWERITE